MSSLKNLEAELKDAIAQLKADQAIATEAKSRIASVESQKRRIESELAQLREQERLRQVEEDLGSEVHQLRQIGDRINEKSRELYAMLNEFEALRVSIVAKQSDLKRDQKAAIQNHCDFNKLPVFVHRCGAREIFLTTRGKADCLRDAPNRGVSYGFNVDEALGI